MQDFTKLVAGTLALVLLSGAAAAQSYPSRQVRFIVGFSPGGGTDVVTRLIADHLTRALGQQVFVDNRPGAASNIAGEIVATSPPDGYTIFMGTISTSSNRTLYRKIKYDALKDFAPVTQVLSTPFLFAVHPSLPPQNLKAFIAFAKARPGELNYASAGSGSGAHLFSEMFRMMTGVDIVHIPYKGAAPATTALLAGETMFKLDNIVTTLKLARSGKLRALAVTTLTRSSAAPEIPTMDEAGVPGYDANAWFGVFAPAGTPPEIIARLNSEIIKILKEPKVRDTLLVLGGEPVGSTPAEFGAFFKNEVDKWGKVIREAKMQID
ncbi:MAG: tripartite tricarboxylate transporter substrate binding protein [Betaproteobacteria bacterium]|nr:tripartite tricarboxylate transporter substrate binding protein [Betaproteobacteria bacterium]